MCEKRLLTDEEFAAMKHNLINGKNKKIKHPKNEAAQTTAQATGRTNNYLFFTEQKNSFLSKPFL